MRILWISKASVTASYRKKIALLARLGLSMGVLTGSYWGAWRFEEDSDDVHYQIFRRPQHLSGRNHFHWYGGMSEVIRHFQPDLIHIDEEHYSLVTSQVVRSAERLRIPIVFQTWQNIFKRYPFPFSAMERYVFSHAKAAIAGTEEVKDVLKRQGFQKPIRVIPLGVDTDIFYPDANPAYRRQFATDDRWAVGFVGRLVSEKGVMDLAGALAPLLQIHANWVWIVAGAGPLEAPLREFMQTLGIDGQLRLIPWLGTHDMAHLMNALDVLVVPSRTTPHWKEQFGRVLIEAMAAELPVLAYGSGEIPNVVGDAGIVVPEGDTDALSRHLQSLWENPERASALKPIGLQRVRDHFSQQRVADLLKDLYQDVLD